MELEKFISNFADQFDDTDAMDIQANTEFKELDEWSSMLVLAVIAMARTDYGKDITAADIRSCLTVQNLFTLIESK